MIKKSIPNLITCLNLACGVLAILTDDLTLGVYLIILGGIFDVFDGLVARALNVTSSIGKELDSLADVVSFGVAPATLFYKAFAVDGQYLYLVGVIFIVVAGALRLARFNTTESESSYFEGLAIPASGLILCSLVYAREEIQLNLGLFLGVTLLLAILNVSQIKMFSFKQISQGLVKFYFGFLVGVGIAFLLWKPALALAIVLGSYVLLALIDHLRMSLSKT